MVETKISVQLGMLDKLMAVANAAQDGEQILRQSLAIICGAYETWIAAIYLFEAGQPRLAVHRGPERSIPYLRELEEADDFWRRCLRGELAILPIEEAVEVGQALVGLPLLARTAPVGCLVLGLGATALQELDRDFMRTMGRAIGLAIENASLYQQMEQRLRESQTLYEISRAFSSTLDLDNLLNLIVRQAVDTITNADNGVLHLLDEETGELRPRALSFVGEVRPDRSGRSRMHIGEGLAGIALERGELMNVPDVSQDPRFIRVGEVRRFASMLVAPLKMGDRKLGTLSIDSARPNAFSASDERLITTLAAQAAAALENARLVHDLQRSLDNLRETQAQLIQSAKLSAVGQLIAGVAHELNNPLTAVMGYAQLLQTSEGLDPEVLRDVAKIYAQAERAAKIVQNLLTFAREYKAERHLVDVNEILSRTIELRLYQLRVENIEVEVRLAEQKLTTWADGNQLQQVFLNLINNAQDAMVEHRGGGRLTIVSSCEGERIRVDISDDGPGLSAEVRQHLFEPFFTTKEVGKGTGLGLSICFGIVSEHDGVIEVESEEGHGTTFKVFLPLVKAEGPVTTKAESQQPHLPRGRRTLIVEDERDVASLLERILRQEGHEIVLASNGQEALEALTQDESPSFDLIISDIKMPGLDGRELYDRLLKRSPKMCRRLVFITGDTLSPETSSFLQRTQVSHVPKPFNIPDLLNALACVLKQSELPSSEA
ncbi:MAG: GAF domain-containing protein [Chloroflexi bacterium]|nr:GAF domain-containing protein [Chloroflexota bacterium]